MTEPHEPGGMVERVARAIHEHLCRRNVMQYLDNDEDCEALAQAALAASGADRMREALERILRMRPAGDVATATNTRALVQQMEAVARQALGATQ